jgi:hypothetical protein
MAESESLERTRFHSGRLLTAEDFTREQDYFREKLQRHNRTLHGFGVVSGFGVSTGEGNVAVEPGLALDCQGNEILVGDAQSLPLPSTPAATGIVYVNVRYTEVACRAAIVDGGPEASLIQSTVRESFELCFGKENCTRGHRHLRARWLTCGEAHPLTIAKLRCGSRGWRIDRRYRPPFIK